ncbi:hypothetical protein D3C79_518380 [compost metagenome]
MAIKPPNPHSYWSQIVVTGRELGAVMREVAHGTFARGRQQPALLYLEVLDGLGIASLGNGSTHSPQIKLWRQIQNFLLRHTYSRQKSAKILITFENLCSSRLKTLSPLLVRLSSDQNSLGRSEIHGLYPRQASVKFALSVG